MKAQVLVCN